MVREVHDGCLQACTRSRQCDRAAQKLHTCGEATDYTRAADARMHDRDNISKFALERGVEVCAALYRTEAVAVRQL